MDIKKFAY